MTPRACLGDNVENDQWFIGYGPKRTEAKPYPDGVHVGPSPVTMRSIPGVALASVRIRAAAVVLGSRPKQRARGLSPRCAYLLGAAAIILDWPDAVSPSPVITRVYEPDIHNTVTCLASLGRPRILHVTGHTRARIALFCAVINEFGVEPIVECGNFSPCWGSHANRRLLQRAHPRTAVLYTVDPRAIGGMRIAGEPGTILHGELAATGTEAAETGRHSYAMLSMLAVDPGRWGRAAADALVAQWRTVGPTTLLCRQQQPSRESSSASVAYFPAQALSWTSTRTKTSRKTKEQ